MWENMKKSLLISVPILVFGLAAQASENNRSHSSKYAGQESRATKSLSPDDISELKRGGGWGLAKAAELNGVPGPAHLLELKDEIPLNAAQVLKIQKILFLLSNFANSNAASREKSISCRNKIKLSIFLQFSYFPIGKIS